MIHLYTNIFTLDMKLWIEQKLAQKIRIPPNFIRGFYDFERGGIKGILIFLQKGAEQIPTILL